MIVKKFISKVADGTLSNNDIIEYAAGKEDKLDLLWSLFLADIACEDHTGKPQISDNNQINRIKNAIDVISRRFNIDLLSEETKSLKYNGISKKLSKWINGADDEILESIILNKKIPEGKNKPEWVGNKAEAHRFKVWIGATEKPMIECFRGLNSENFWRSGSPKTDSKIELRGSIWDVLKEYTSPTY